MNKLNDKYIVVNVNSKQFLLREGQRFFCDRLKFLQGEIVKYPILACSESFNSKGDAEFLVLRHFLGKKRVVFYKTKRNADKHFGGKGGARPLLTELQLVKFQIEGVN